MGAGTTLLRGEARGRGRRAGRHARGAGSRGRLRATLAPMDAAAASRDVIIVRRARVPADPRGRWEEAPRRAPLPARSNARAKKYLRRAQRTADARALSPSFRRFPTRACASPNDRTRVRGPSRPFVKPRTPCCSKLERTSSHEQSRNICVSSSRSQKRPCQRQLEHPSHGGTGKQHSTRRWILIGRRKYSHFALGAFDSHGLPVRICCCYCARMPD